MAPTTRQTDRSTPPPNEIIVREASTTKKTRFFDAFDARSQNESTRSICRDLEVDPKTGRRWLQQRREIGQKAYRRTRNRSSRLGRPFSVTEKELQMLISPSKNPVRNQAYEAQIAYHKIPLRKRALQQNLTHRASGSRRYKQAYVSKILSQKNREKRVKFGQKHQGFSVEDFWQYVFFTDEAHIDPTSTVQGHILRPQGTRYKPQNIQQRGEKKGVRLHVAAWVNWHGKGDLQFYNDKNDQVIRPPRPPKPRKTMYETDDAFTRRIDEWEASLPYEREYKPKGNSMTQKYYCKRLLPYYIDGVGQARLNRPAP